MVTTKNTRLRYTLSFSGCALNYLELWLKLEVLAWHCFLTCFFSNVSTMIVGIMLLVISIDAFTQHGLNIWFYVNSCFAILFFYLLEHILFKELRKAHWVRGFHSFYLHSFKSTSHSELTFSGNCQNYPGPHHSAQAMLFMAVWIKPLWFQSFPKVLSEVTGNEHYNEQERKTYRIVLPKEWKTNKQKKNK